MPWGFAIGALGAVGGGLIASEGSKDAAEIQRGAAGDASGVQRDIFATTNRQQQPFVGSGYGALSSLNRLLGTPQPIYGQPDGGAVPGVEGALTAGSPASGATRWNESNGRLIGDTWLPRDVVLEDQGKGWYHVKMPDGTYLGNLRPGGPSGRFENVGAAVPPPPRSGYSARPMPLPGGGELMPPQDPMPGLRIPTTPGRMQGHSVQKMGRAGDDYLVHVNKDELGQMHEAWGKPSVNPNTGLREYGFWSRIRNALEPENIGRTILDPAGGTIAAIRGEDASLESLIDPGGFFVDEGDLSGGGGGGGGGTPSGAGAYGMSTPIGFTPDMTGLPDGYLTQRFGPEQFREGVDPGYQWRFQQGLQGVMNSTAPTYGALSGPALKALISYGQGEASGEFNNAFNRFQTQQGNIFQRLSSLVNLGQNAAAGVGQQGTAVGGNIGSNIVGAGNAGAAGTVGSANAWAGALGSLGSLGYLAATQPPRAAG